MIRRFQQYDRVAFSYLVIGNLIRTIFPIGQDEPSQHSVVRAVRMLTCFDVVWVLWDIEQVKGKNREIRR